MSNTETHYNEIINWLEGYFRKQGLPTYRGLEYSTEFQTDVGVAKERGTKFSIDPMLPIDLVMVRSRKEIDHETRKSKETYNYTLFWVASSASRTLERNLLFYQIYLSRISEPRAVRIVIVIPSDSKKTLERSLHTIAKENGFGLWRITFQEEPEVICAPQSFLEHMENSFANPPKDMMRFSRAIRDKAPDIALFFDRYIIDAVDAVVGVTPTDVGKRFIEREILDSVLNLEKISYGQELKKLVIKHLREKSDDYDFVSDTFSTLWSHCNLGMNYSKFLEIAELPLYNIFASRKKPYRDHYLHQFQVFLLGLGIIDKLKVGMHPDLDEHPDIDIQWLITSSFHDMAYPLELYDIWAKEFFDESIGIPDIGVSDLKSSFVDKSLLSILGFLVNTLCEKHFDCPLKGNWLHEERELVQFFHDRITQLKHHCLLSSIFLLKQAQSKSPALLDKLFVPSGLAIALHHRKDIWRKLPDRKRDEVWKKLPQKRKFRSLDFKTDPLTFLLIFCDCIQEWGRPTRKYPKQDNLAGDEKKFILSSFKPTESGCSVIIKTPQISRTHKVFKSKVKEIEGLEEFLKSSSGLQFQITLEDRFGITRVFPITGTQV